MQLPHTKIIYIVNARIPNERAHGIQIGQTVAALGSIVSELTLVTPGFIGAPKVATYKNYKHLRLLSIDVPFLKQYRFYIRLVSFIVFLQGYLLFELLTSLYTGKKVVLYVRGEIIFGIVPFFKLCDVYYETHQIRNHHRSYEWVIKRVAGIVVVTDRLRSKFISEFKIDPTKIIVARDAVDMEKFASPSHDATERFATEVKLPPDTKIVLYTGSLGYEKGVGTLAEAAQYLPEGVQVVFVGGNKWEMDSFRERYGTFPNISILEKVHHADIPLYLHRADLLILPDLATDEYSNLYTSPMKLFEYMASGKAIVASDVPSLREVLDDTTAFFFSSGDSRQLAEVIVLALQNREESHRRAALAQKEVAKYTWDKRAEHIVALIQTFS